MPGRPCTTSRRLAAALLEKGGEQRESDHDVGAGLRSRRQVLRQKAVAGLDSILPKDKQARMKALASLVGTMPKDELDQLVAELFGDYR